LKKEAIKLLKQQLEKLDAKDFDLNAWKKYTVVILSRVFGEDNLKIKQVEDLEFEYNSWSLRDASGNESYEDGTIKLAREIIQASIDEITAFGIPESKSSMSNKELENYLNIILDELKGSQLKQLKTIIASENSSVEKKRLVFEIIETMGENTVYEVITNIISQPSAIKILEE